MRKRRQNCQGLASSRATGLLRQINYRWSTGDLLEAIVGPKLQIPLFRKIPESKWPGPDGI